MKNELNKDAWKSKGKCYGMDTNYFYEKYEEDLDFRNGIDYLCKTCPLQRLCLAVAVSNNEWGVWGGVYLEKGKVSKEFNSHKKNDEWFDLWKFLTMEVE